MAKGKYELRIEFGVDKIKEGRYEINLERKFKVKGIDKKRVDATAASIIRKYIYQRD